MEHIVQFAVSIDDTAIEKRIMETAHNQIIDAIRHEIERELFEVRYGSFSNMRQVGVCIVEEWLNDHKQEIIDKAAEHLADKLARTKAAKEMLTEVLADNG